MPRKARRESSTGHYHVIMRGNNKNFIFSKTKYKELMKKLIFRQVGLELIELYAWCIMDNHIHLVLRAQKKELFEAMFNINNEFAKKYNKSEKTVGHVFQNRYKSECIEEDEYLKCVIQYVHNNPVKAKMVSVPQAYGWSSYDHYIKGNQKNQTINIIEAYFNNDLEAFISYHQLEDDEEYLEIKEDLVALREEKAQKIINKYCQRYQITDATTIHMNPNIRAKIIKEMVQTSKLPYRRIAEIVGMSVSSVHEISKSEANF